jgi:hypothetical protein
VEAERDVMRRLGSCPVLLVARTRGRFVRESDERLISEILAGAASGSELPPCVREALAMLDDRRAGRLSAEV